MSRWLASRQRQHVLRSSIDLHIASTSASRRSLSAVPPRHRGHQIRPHDRQVASSGELWPSRPRRVHRPRRCDECNCDHDDSRARFLRRHRRPCRHPPARCGADRPLTDGGSGSGGMLDARCLIDCAGHALPTFRATAGAIHQEPDRPAVQPPGRSVVRPSGPRPSTPMTRSCSIESSRAIASLRERLVSPRVPPRWNSVATIFGRRS